MSDGYKILFWILVFTVIQQCDDVAKIKQDLKQIQANVAQVPEAR
jgi:hypothetical protein